MGCACIVSDAEGCIELIANSEGGMIVPKKDVTALADAIRTLWLDNSKRLQMGNSARKRVIDHYSVERMCAEIEEVYRKGLIVKNILP